MTAKYRLMFGLCPDEYGYIVPRYDFMREPVDPQKMQIKRSVDPCKEKGVPNHYHETNSASSELAPATACVSFSASMTKLFNEVCIQRSNGRAKPIFLRAMTSMPPCER